MTYSITNRAHRHQVAKCSKVRTLLQVGPRVSSAQGNQSVCGTILYLPSTEKGHLQNTSHWKISKGVFSKIVPIPRHTRWKQKLQMKILSKFFHIWKLLNCKNLSSNLCSFVEYMPIKSKTGWLISIWNKTSRTRSANVLLYSSWFLWTIEVLNVIENMFLLFIKDGV